MKNYKEKGNWWNDNNIDLIEINGTVYALNGWNGEKYTDCWECTGEHHMDAGRDCITVAPIYDSAENENGGYDVIGYNVE